MSVGNGVEVGDNGVGDGVSVGGGIAGRGVAARTTVGVAVDGGKGEGVKVEMDVGVGVGVKVGSERAWFIEIGRLAT